MLGLVVKDNPKLIIEKLREKGVLACSAGYDVVRFVPPLIISKEEVNIVIDALDDVLSKFWFTFIWKKRDSSIDEINVITYYNLRLKTMRP